MVEVYRLKMEIYQPFQQNKNHQHLQIVLDNEPDILLLFRHVFFGGFQRINAQSLCTLDTETDCGSVVTKPLRSSTQLINDDIYGRH